MVSAACVNFQLGCSGICRARIYFAIIFILLQVSTPEMKLERDIFLYRAYIALRKYGVVINEISGSSSQQLQALKTLAEYFAQPSKR